MRIPLKYIEFHAKEKNGFSQNKDGISLQTEKLKESDQGKIMGQLLYHRTVPANNMSLYLKVIMKQMYLLWYLK